MVKNLKSITKIVMLCFSISLFSCQDEIVENERHAKVHDPNAVSYEAFKANTHISSVKEFFKEKTTKNSPTAKGVSLPEYAIDTLLIKQYVTSETKSSYTFRIYPKELTEVDTASIYNLVINKVDNEWETIIFHLERDTPENIANSHKVYKSISEVYRSYGLPNEFGRMSWCSNTSYTVQCNGSCEEHKISPCDGFGCPTGECLSATISWGLCGVDDIENPTAEQVNFIANIGPSAGGGGSTGSSSFYSGANAILREINLKPSQINWLNKQEAGKKAMVDYLVANKNSNSKPSQDLVKWGIDYLISNPTVTIEMFKNWFLGETQKGQDGEYVDPDLIQYETPVVQQPLPTLANWFGNFPKKSQDGYWLSMSSVDVYQLVGGSIYTSSINPLTKSSYTNACAIRGSRALLYSGISIPVLKYGNPPQQVTQKGGDNKNYILAATSFNKFMLDKFGETPHKLEGADANDPKKVADFLKGKSGIYVIINANPGKSGAGYSGHVDTIVNGICLSNPYFQNVPGGIKSIRIWVLK